MFQINNVRRIDAETVLVTVTMDAKAWTKARSKGLGMLYGIDISNAVYREYGIKAYNPTVADRDRAKAGIKTIQLYYADSVWIPKPNNVVRVQFAKRLTKEPVSPADVVKVDFVARKRIA